ncbi:unnamed protein product [Pieris macdunnoughi]|uniref:Uncharacterized protein n=1 Tax=Pieris macdunnoughi TaxID=345717 RepID=A0A821TE67_9NEOP|nr:unnamed protein product [Pieris macdunnoughi]
MQFSLSAKRRSGFYPLDPREVSNIVGVPSIPNHLPEAESILPGHTLIRPSLGMLKSAVKFPHRELEDAAGVYGNIENLGIRYDAKNERVLYSGFRRSPSDYVMYLFSLREINKDSKAILRNEHEDILHSSSADIISIEERSTTPKSIEFEGGVTEKNWIKAHVMN